MKRCLIALLAVMLALSGISALGEAGGLLKLTLTGGRFDYEAAREMLPLINELRTQDAWYWSADGTKKVTVSGLQALTYDYALERVAMLRAAEIAVYYSHTRPDTRAFFTAYPDSIQGSNGENIFYGFTGVDEAFTAWAEADKPYSGQAHRRNMLGLNYKTIGVGCYALNGVQYWVQEYSDVSTGAAPEPLTLPQTISVSPTVIKGLYAIGDVQLSVNGRQPLSGIRVAALGKENWYAVPCAIEGMTWSSDSAAVATIDGSAVVGKAAGTTSLKGQAGGLTVAAPVKVTGALTRFDIEVGGTLLLDDAQTGANLVVKVPAVTGAARFSIRTYERETGWQDGTVVDGAGSYGFSVESDDDAHPIHLTVTVTALDGDGDEIARATRNAVLYPVGGVLRLPDKTTAVGEEAFTGAAAYCAIVPNGCKSIGAQAFAGDLNLCSISIPASVTEIADDAFAGCSSSLVIYAPAGSAAAGLAQKAGFTWFEMDA